MYKLTVVALILIVAANNLYAQERMCKRWPRVLQVISAENVQQICSLGANPGRIIEARWHKIEPILVLWSFAAEVGATSNSHFYVWDVENNIGRFGISDRSFAQLELTPELLIMGADSGSLMFWDLMQETFLYELPVHDGEVSELLLHPSDEWLLVIIDQARAFSLSLESRAVAEIHLQGSQDFVLGTLAFSSDGRMLAVAGNETIGIWDTDSWEVWSQGPLSAEWVADLHFVDGDSQLIVLADRSVDRWSLPNKEMNKIGKLLSHPEKYQCRILGGDISPDGSLLMTTDECGQLRAWDLRMDQEIFIPQLQYFGEDHVGVPTRFSPDGRYLVDRSEPYAFTWLIVPAYDGSSFPQHKGE